MQANKIHENLLKLGKEWADKVASASLFEETKKTLLAQLKLKSNEKSDAARETEALASDEYHRHIVAMVKAQKEANQAKVAYDGAKTWVDLQRTEAATRRAELKNLNMLT